MICMPLRSSGFKVSGKVEGGVGEHKNAPPPNKNHRPNPFPHPTTPTTPGGSPIWYTGTGLAFRHQWGSLRNVLGPAFIIAQYGHAIRDIDPKKSGRYTCWARGQLRYALGDAGRSFVVGYGNNPPQRVHHRAASCPTVTGPWGTNSPTCDFSQFNSGSPNPQVLYGALAGGPDGGDNYSDHRDDYVRNEVAVDYNAGFTGVLAYLTQSEDTLAACRARGDVVREVRAKGW